MCGIVGAVAERDVVPILLEGLRRLEYRGYDSAGIAVLDQENTLQRCRAVGKVHELDKAILADPLSGCVGVAHTRWATHGPPSEENAHPLQSGPVVVVHNGIIENHDEFRQLLIEAGYTFQSDTDTEVVAHLLSFYLKQNYEFLAAVKQVVSQLKGAFALGFIYGDERERLIAVRQGCPLVVGVGLGEHFIASDHLALLPVTQQFVFLEEGDVVDIRRDSFVIYAKDGQLVEREMRISQTDRDNVDRGNYRHFMQKEIFEQPQAVRSTLQGRLTDGHVPDHIFGYQAASLFKQVKHVQIVACGTSYHAGLVARYWLESLAGISCQVEIASEFRYREPVVQTGTLFVTLSQSGETADTLAALRMAKTRNYLSTLALCNVPESALVRESDSVLLTQAGREIGVASTKAFTTQLVAALLLTLALGRHHHLSAEKSAQLIQELKELPALLEGTLTLDNEIQALAAQFADKQHALFLGRGVEYPIALEGALKLKELSYIHAEAYPAGELKHGPLALVDKEMPVVVVAPNDALHEKLKSNLQEVRARGGQLIVFADPAANLSTGPGVSVINMPVSVKTLAPIVYTLPLQLLSYHVAVLKGTDVDQPRNLAKSVTVE